MRITVMVNEGGLGYTAQKLMRQEWASLDAAVEYFEADIKKLGKTCVVDRDPCMEGNVRVEIEIAPTAVTIVDQETGLSSQIMPMPAYIEVIDEEVHVTMYGYSAESWWRFSQKHGDFLSALSESEPGVKATRERMGVPEPAAAQWFSDLHEIERRIRAHDAIRMMVSDGSKVVRVQMWDVLIGLRGDGTLVVICDGLKSPVKGPIVVGTDRIPRPTVYVPWNLFRQLVRSGRQVLIGNSFIEDTST